jgi:drug/metabolite transporter (DMT)-like permease
LVADRWDCVFYALAAFDAVCWGLYSAISRRSGTVSGGSGVIPIFQGTLGLMLPVLFLPAMHQWSHGSVLMIAAVGAYCFLQYLAYLSWDIGMRLGNIVVLSLIADFIPFVSLVASHFMLGVDIGNRTIFSAVFLVSGAMVTRYATVAGKSRRSIESAAKSAVQDVALA